MKIQLLKFYLICFITMAFVIGCSRKTNSINPNNTDNFIDNGNNTFNFNNPTTTNNTPSTNTGDSITDDFTNLAIYPNPGQCNRSRFDGGGIVDGFYRTDVVGFGSGPTNNPISWSSETDLSEQDQQIYLTDSRFRFRVVARPAPPRFTPAANSTRYPSQHFGQQQTLTSCFFSDPYLRLKMDIRVRARNSTNAQIRRINNLHIDNGTYSRCSDIQDIDMGQIATNEPLVIEIMNVEWDRCGRPPGFEGPSEQNPCSFNYVFEKSCFQLELQVVTDHTHNFD